MVPEFNVEAEVDMEILVVVIMEDAVWLPGLPPLRLQFGVIIISAVKKMVGTFYLESYAGVVNDAVIINIEQHEAVHSWGGGVE